MFVEVRGLLRGLLCGGKRGGAYGLGSGRA